MSGYCPDCGNTQCICKEIEMSEPKKCKYVPTIECTTNEPCGNWCEVHQDAHRMTEPKAGATPENRIDRPEGGWNTGHTKDIPPNEKLCAHDNTCPKAKAGECIWSACMYYDADRNEISVEPTTPKAADRELAEFNGGTAKEWYDMMQEIDKRGSEWKAKAAKQAEVIEECGRLLQYVRNFKGLNGVEMHQIDDALAMIAGMEVE